MTSTRALCALMLTLTFMGGEASAQTPTLTAPNPVTAGASGWTASVPARAGMTYLWSLSSGTITSPGGSAGEAVGGLNRITFTAGPEGSLTVRVSEIASNQAVVQVVAPPVAPVITAPASAAGGTPGLTASVPARAGFTYAWSISGGTLSDAGVSAGGVNTVTFEAGGGSSLTLTCTELNAAGTASAPGSATVALTPAPPRTPTLTAAGPVTAGATGTASVLAREGYTYAWTVTNGSTSNSSGVTAGGKNTLTYTADVEGTLDLQVVELNVDGVRSAPATASVTVVAAPLQPSIAVASPVAADAANLTASVTARPGMSYRWTVTNATLTNAGGAAGVTAGGKNTVTFTAGSSGTVELSCVETNAAGAASAPATASAAIVRMSGNGHIYFVSHQDDDLIFFDPDLQESLLSGKPTKVVWVMAGGSGDGGGVWQARENQSRNYILSALGLSSGTWTCGARAVGLKSVYQCSLDGHTQITTVHLRLPDGSLARLWATATGAPFYVTPAASLTSTDAVKYTRAELLDTMAQLVTDFGPSRVATHDGMFAYGDDHSDHVASALFALEGARRYTVPHEVRQHRGYNVAPAWDTVPAADLVNLSATQLAEKNRNAGAYGITCSPGDAFGEYCRRHYAVSSVQAGAGPLVVGLTGKCLAANGTAADGVGVRQAPCDGSAAQVWSLKGNGNIEGPAGLCLNTDTTNAVRLNTCTGANTQKWVAFSNGQVRGREALCLTANANGTGTSMALCDADRSTSSYTVLSEQRFVRQLGTASAWTASGQLGTADLAAVPALGLGDVDGDGRADACARRADGVYCALNTGAGSFGAPTRWSAGFGDAAGFSDEAHGGSVQLADLNADGLADLCGRGPTGLVCALSTGSGFAAASAWSSDAGFADAAFATAATYRTVRLGDVNGDGQADVCGRVSAGVRCALSTGAGFGAATMWDTAEFTDARGYGADAYGTTLMLADINGDHRADVCGRLAAGVRCAVSTGSGFIEAKQWSLHKDFTDASGWNVAGLYRSLRLADVNGDGQADLCGRGANGIVCGISHGEGFDAALAVQTGAFTNAQGWNTDAAASSLQFGDLLRTGRAGVCGLTSSGVVCSGNP